MEYAPQFSDNAVTLKDKNFFYKFSNLGGILHISAKLQGGICKTSCWLTEEFDGGGKLINVVQFQRDNWSFVNFRGNWRNLQFQGVIAYLLVIKSWISILSLCLKNKTLKNKRGQLH